jgi:hypothetical protein
MRGDPVPYTGKRRTHKGRFYNFHRTPKNIGVRRGLIGVKGDLKGEKVPPNSWEDLLRASLFDRSWKRFRRTKWRAKC